MSPIPIVFSLWRGTCLSISMFGRGMGGFFCDFPWKHFIFQTLVTSLIMNWYNQQLQGANCSTKPMDDRAHDITNRDNALIIGKSLKITRHSYCLIPPIWMKNMNYWLGLLTVKHVDTINVALLVIPCDPPDMICNFKARGLKWTPCHCRASSTSQSFVRKKKNGLFSLLPGSVALRPWKFTLNGK